MFCHRCGKELQAGVMFCSYCGAGINAQSGQGYCPPPQYQGVYYPRQSLLQQLSGKIKTEAIIWLSVACIQYLLGSITLMSDYAGYGIIVILIAVLNTIFSVRDFKYSKEVLERPVGIVKKYQPVGGTIGTLIYNIFFGGLIGIAGSIYAFVLRSFVMSNQNQFMQIEWETNNHAGANPVNNQTFPNGTYYNVTAPPYMQPQPQSWGQQGNVQPSVPYNGSDTMLFTHTCSKCGYTFNVKYTKREDQNKIPALIAACPQCKSKEIINS